jgi:adenylate cyclase
VRRLASIFLDFKKPLSRLAQKILHRIGFFVVLVVVLLSVATTVRVIDPFLVSALRQLTFDWYQRLHPESYDPDSPVRIVDIDEASLSKIGQWPWPRTVLGDLLTDLADKGAAAVGFDVLFVEPDRSSIEEIAKRLPAAQASSLLQIAAGERSNDQVFADALRDSPSVLGISLSNGPTSLAHAKAGFAIAGDDPRQFIPSFSGASNNLAVLDTAAHGIGSVNWLPDSDQIVRRVPLLYRVGAELVPSFAAEVLRVAQGASTFVLKAANASGETAFGRNTGLNHLKIGDIEIPTDADGKIIIKFRHSNPAAYIPAWKVLAGEVSREDIAGRIILVGTSAPGLLDLRGTPLDSAVPGIEIHAQLLEHILAGRSLVRPDYALALEESMIVVLGLLLAVILPRVTASGAAGWTLLTAGALLFAGWLAYYLWGLVLDTTYPALALGGMAACITTTFIAE